MKNEAQLTTRDPLHNPLIGGTNDANYWPRCAHQIIVAAIATSVAKRRGIFESQSAAATTRFVQI